MNNKIKLLDLFSLITIVLYLGFIFFLILSVVFYNIWTNESPVLSSEQNTQLLIVFILWIIFLSFSVVATIAISFIFYLTDWKDSDINDKKRLYFFINIILVTLNIPAIIFVKKIYKSAMSSKSTKPPVTSSNQNKQVTTNASYIQPNNLINVQTTTTTTTISSESYEPYFENNQWKYNDGKDTWIMDETSNEWVKQEN